MKKYIVLALTSLMLTIAYGSQTVVTEKQECDPAAPECSWNYCGDVSDCKQFNI